MLQEISDWPGLLLFDMPNSPYLNEAIESIRKISSLDIDRLFCYHGGAVEGDIKKKLMKLQSKYQEQPNLPGRPSTVNK
jgi:hypothetical protein